MKVLIIYDDVKVAAKASAVLRQAVPQKDFNVELNIVPWRAGVLRFPAAATEALMDAADAHLIVFAGSGTAPWLLGWLTEWVKIRQVEDAALAVLSADSTGSFSLSASPDVSRFASQHGLNLIYDEGDGPRDSFEFLNDPLSGHKTNPGTTGNRHWGINE